VTIAAQTTHDVAVDYYKQSFGTITDVSIPRTALLQAKVARATAYSDTLAAAASARFQRAMVVAGLHPSLAVGSVIFFLLANEDRRSVQPGDRLVDIHWDVSRQLKVEIACAADPQERGEVPQIVAGINGLVMQLGYQLRDVHAIAVCDFLELRPEEILQPNACHHAIDA